MGSPARGHAEPGEPHDQRCVTAGVARTRGSAPARARCHPEHTVCAPRRSTARRRARWRRPRRVATEAVEGRTTPRPDAVPALPPGAPQRAAGPDLPAIAGHPSTTRWLRSYPRCPASREERTAWRDDARACPDARPPRGTRADPAFFVPRNYRPLIASEPIHRLACAPRTSTAPSSAHTLTAATRGRRELSRSAWLGIIVASDFAMATRAGTSSGACRSRPEHQVSCPMSGQYLESMSDTYTEQHNLVTCRMPPRQRGRDKVEGVALSASLSASLRAYVRNPDITAKALHRTDLNSCGGRTRCSSHARGNRVDEHPHPLSLRRDPARVTSISKSTRRSQGQQPVSDPYAMT